MYPVGLHIHTAASTHACSILNGYIAQAKQKGIKLFAITGHGSDIEDAPHHWHFINMRTWPRMVDGVGILRGIEANIKNIDGEVDCSDEMFDPLDLTIASFHEPVFAPHDKAVNTQVMIAIIASSNVHVISHPGNPKYEIDVKAATEAATKHQVALEISNPSFLHSRKDSEDNCCVVAAAVRDTGGWVALGSDFHAASIMGEFEECLRILDAVSSPSERTLNVSPRRLLNLLKSRGMTPIVEFADL